MQDEHSGGTSFEVASGSVVGIEHVHAGRPNQDAISVRRHNQVLVVAVADGCSDGTHNEVGAHVGVSVATQSVLRWSSWRARQGWIMTDKDDPHSIRQAFMMASRSMVRASQAVTGGNFSQAAGGGFASP